MLSTSLMPGQHQRTATPHVRSRYCNRERAREAAYYLERAIRATYDAGSLDWTRHVQLLVPDVIKERR